jgi:hypothetical protein
MTANAEFWSVSTDVAGKSQTVKARAISNTDIAEVPFRDLHRLAGYKTAILRLTLGRVAQVI